MRNLFTRAWLTENGMSAVQLLARGDEIRNAVEAYESGDVEAIRMLKQQREEYLAAALNAPACTTCEAKRGALNV